jgi:hypothetical protein
MRYAIAAIVLTCAALGVVAQAPKKGYILAQIDVTNPAHDAEYAKLSPAIIDKFDGRFLARGGKS